MAMLQGESFSTGMTELIRRLDAALAHPTVAARSLAVKAILMESVTHQSLLLPPTLLVSTPEGYARRLLHRDPSDRYTVVVMVWGPGQGTPLHDHAGLWCVECVYQGRMCVTSYEALGDLDGETLTFREVSAVTAGVGQAGALIPPFEYHVMENAAPDRAVTVHVYGGEMTVCNVFVPVDTDGRYRRERRSLVYTP